MPKLVPGGPEGNAGSEASRSIYSITIRELRASPSSNYHVLDLMFKKRTVKKHFMTMTHVEVIRDAVEANKEGTYRVYVVS